MQLISSGPDIPNGLIQNHEEGNVVFFCGAGISIPAGFPSYEELAKDLYESFYDLKFDDIKTEIENCRYDVAIGLLEKNLENGRFRVREKLCEIFKKPRMTKKRKLTHDALINLSRCNDGRIKLVTTNFDQVFEKVRDKNTNIYTAPFLPSVKKHAWDGIVYLHGLIPAKCTNNQLENIVLTSGDFGDAYISERWASKFVSDLFKKYTVCFIGYGINDPVIRYLMDALAADKTHGEKVPEAFAFVEYKEKDKNTIIRQWKNKNVTPILFKLQNNDDGYYGYSILHETIQEWGEKHRKGIDGKIEIINSSSLAKPSESTEEDDFIGRMLWAISDPTGIPAKVFAYQEPPPPFEWIHEFIKPRFEKNDLEKLITFHLNQQTKFGLIDCPLFGREISIAYSEDTQLRTTSDRISEYLFFWISKHCDNKELIELTAQQGGILHPRLKHYLNESEKFRNLEGSIAKYWQLLFSRKIRNRHIDKYFEFYEFENELKKKKKPELLRRKFLSFFEPYIVINKPDDFFGYFKSKRNSQKEKMEDLFSCDVSISIQNPYSLISDTKDDPNWINLLYISAFDLTLLLRDAIKLSEFFEKADQYFDLSSLAMTSIENDEDNRDMYNWTIIIALLRDSWLETKNRDANEARVLVSNWKMIKYPVFKRLILFAYTNSNLFSPSEIIDLLKEDNSFWLWSFQTESEIIRLFNKLSKRFNDIDLKQIEELVLQDPPVKEYGSINDKEKIKKEVYRDRIIRLQALKKHRKKLSKESEQTILEIRKKYPEWFISEDRFEESNRSKTKTGWIGKDQKKQTINDIEIKSTFDNKYNELKEQIETNNDWDIQKWRTELDRWASDKRYHYGWKKIALLLLKMPESEFIEIQYQIGRWVREIGISTVIDEAEFFKLAKKGLDIYKESEGYRINDDQITLAINHPIGYIVEGVKKVWSKRKLENDKKLPKKIKEIFNIVCNKKHKSYIHGRVILANSLVTIYAVDPEWAEYKLLPNFNWGESEGEATALWSGLLWSLRWYIPLMEKLKNDFLETSKYYSKLDIKIRSRYCELLVFVGLGNYDPIAKDEIRDTIQSLPNDGLADCAKYLTRSQFIGYQKNNMYWKETIKPFMDRCWPTSKERKIPELSGHIAELCVETGDNFGEAYRYLKEWLQLIKYPGRILRNIKESSIPELFPNELIEFLVKILNLESGLFFSELKSIMDQMDKKKIKRNKNYEAIKNYLRRYGNL